MCVIAIKQKGLPMMEDDIIRDMFRTNPNGAGLMYLNKVGKVHIEKGFFQVNKLLRYIHDKENILANTDVILHFRISTSGKTDQLGCHPYSVWSKNTSISSNVELGMAHNGVLDGLGWKGNKEINDTQVFIKDCLRLLPHNFLKNKAICKLIGNSIGTNKLAFLDADGIHTFGDYIKDGDYYYSNTYWKPYIRTYTPHTVNYPNGKKKEEKNSNSISLFTDKQLADSKKYFQDELFPNSDKTDKISDEKSFKNLLKTLFKKDDTVDLGDWTYTEIISLEQKLRKYFRHTNGNSGDTIYYDDKYVYALENTDRYGGLVPDTFTRIRLSSNVA